VGKSLSPWIKHACRMLPLRSRVSGLDPDDSGGGNHVPPLHAHRFFIWNPRTAWTAPSTYVRDHCSVDSGR
jgi:hypothetical protein